jgi:hypothetical protein
MTRASSSSTTRSFTARHTRLPVDHQPSAPRAQRAAAGGAQPSDARPHQTRTPSRALTHDGTPEGSQLAVLVRSARLCRRGQDRGAAHEDLPRLVADGSTARGGFFIPFSAEGVREQDNGPDASALPPPWPSRPRDSAHVHSLVPSVERPSRVGTAPTTRQAMFDSGPVQ